MRAERVREGTTPTRAPGISPGPSPAGSQRSAESSATITPGTGFVPHRRPRAFRARARASLRLPGPWSGLAPRDLPRTGTGEPPGGRGRGAGSPPGTFRAQARASPPAVDRRGARPSVLPAPLAPAGPRDPPGGWLTGVKFSHWDSLLFAVIR